MKTKFLAITLCVALIVQNTAHAGWGWFSLSSHKGPEVGIAGGIPLPTGNLSNGQKNLVAGIAYGAAVPAIFALGYRPIKAWYNKKDKSLEEKLLGIAGIGLTSAATLFFALSSINSFRSTAHD